MYAAPCHEIEHIFLDTDIDYPSVVCYNFYITVSEFSQVLFASFFANGTFCFCHLHYINTSQ